MPRTSTTALRSPSAAIELGAINATRECIRLKPDFQPPYINLGRLLEDAGQAGEAIAQWKALTDQLKGINGDSVKNKLLALEQLGRVLESNQLDGPAEDALRQSIEIVVAQPPVIQHWIALRQRQCKWPVVVGWDHVRAEALMAGISPLSLANLSDDPLFQLARARVYNRELVGRSSGLPTGSGDIPAPRDKSKKLRIGYVSSDFREHAVGFAMTDVLEEHDKSAFEIHAYYCGIDRIDPTRTRIQESVDSWFEINGLTDEQAAARIREDQIDILVDLNGYTKDFESPGIRASSRAYHRELVRLSRHHGHSPPPLYHCRRAYHSRRQRVLLFRKGSEARLLSAK